MSKLMVSVSAGLFLYVLVAGASAQMFSIHDPNCWLDKGQWRRLETFDGAAFRGMFWPVTVPFYGARVVMGFKSPCSEIEIYP